MYVYTQIMEIKLLFIHFSVNIPCITQESNADLPSEYWQIQKLVKYLKVKTKMTDWLGDNYIHVGHATEYSTSWVAHTELNLTLN